MNEIIIKEEFVTLNQFLKLVNLIQTGGEAKFFILKNKIKINGILTKKRNKKIYKNEIIEIKNMLYKLI